MCPEKAMNTGCRIFHDIVVEARIARELRTSLIEGRVIAGAGPRMTYGSLACGLKHFNAGMYFHHVTFEAICNSARLYSEGPQGADSVIRETVQPFPEVPINEDFFKALSAFELDGDVLSTMSGRLKRRHALRHRRWEGG